MRMKKGLKKLLTVVGALVVVVPTSLGVAGCDFRRFLDEMQGPNRGSRTGEHQIVVDAINSASFKLGVHVGWDVENFKSAICVHFIGENLPDNTQRIYNPSLFIKHDIINEQGSSLSTSDLQSPKLIKAKILYDYAEIKDQVANFTIKVV